jgi:hypothetical protein
MLHGCMQKILIKLSARMCAKHACSQLKGARGHKQSTFAADPINACSEPLCLLLSNSCMFLHVCTLPSASLAPKLRQKRSQSSALWQPQAGAPWAATRGSACMNMPPRMPVTSVYCSRARTPSAPPICVAASLSHRARVPCSQAASARGAAGPSYCRRQSPCKSHARARQSTRFWLAPGTQGTKAQHTSPPRRDMHAHRDVISLGDLHRLHAPCLRRTA